jgi:prenyltransferase beta subunit
MFRLTAGIVACITILAFLTINSPAHAQALDAQKVEKAIDQAVRYLLRNQLPDGGWSEYSATYPDGVTALVTLSLLNSGLDPDQAEMARALQYLNSRELEKTYTVALQTMAFCAANPNKYAARIRRNAEWLSRAQLGNGGWSYDQNGSGGDPSNSQFALLALHEARRSGVASFPAETWQRVFGRAKQYWEGLQNRDGSFPYDSKGLGRGSMTCAGVASLVIAGSQLDALQPAALDTVQCCGNVDTTQARIEAGLDWLGNNFSVQMNPGHQGYHLYYIYALERVGRLTGRRFIGEADWYRQGSQQLLAMQKGGVTGKIVGKNNLYQGNEFSETAFALLFLSKGKRQTVVSRLQFRRDEDWRNHPTAIQHLTTYTEQAWKRDLSWQNIDLSKATLEDLLETPVLFFSGSRTPSISPGQKRLLKDYVEQGGFIFAEACNGNGCDGQAFENFFRDLVVELFDQPLEKLSPDHPIWFAESRVSPADLPDGAWLYGVQTCCRLGVVYSPISLSCRWELNLPYGSKPNFSEAVQADLDTCTKIGINVVSYATGKELKQKLDAVTVLEEVRNQIPTDRGVFVLPTLRHNAGSDDAPRAIPNLIQWLDQENPFQMSSEKRLININKEDLEQYPVVFMHGRGELRLTELQRQALREYFGNGGFLFADAICADEAFAASFRREMALILEEPLVNLPESHPLLSRDFYGFDIRRVSVIDPDLSGDSIVSSQRRIAPRLEVGKAGNRMAVVFSPLDLSCALESRHSLQCRGYIREDAARIGINVIMFALQH